MTKKKEKADHARMPTTLFLKKEMVDDGQKPDLYDLKDEFKLARNNRASRLYNSLIIFSALLLIGTFSFTTYISYSYKNIAIEITDFEDINMQEFLATLRNASEAISNMKNAMNRMKGEVEHDKELLRIKARRDLELLRKQQNLSRARRAALARKILRERDMKITAMNSDYRNRLKKKEDSVKDMQKKMADNRARMKQKTAAYVGKLEKKMSDYQGETKAYKANVKTMIRKMGENHELKRREEQKEHLKKVRELTAKIRKTEKSIRASAARNKELGSLFEHYRRALIYYAFLKGEQGHVICVRKNGCLLVELNPMVDRDKPCCGMVINKKGTLIAKINITPKNGLLEARVAKRLKKSPISPFDMIILVRK